MQAEGYIGIDLNEKYAMVSYYTQGMSEPGTFSMVTGSEVYQIPMCISKKKGIGQWLYGEEARKYVLSEGGTCIESLMKKALSKEHVEIEGEIYDTAELFFLFLKKMIALPMHLGNFEIPDKLAITTEYVNPNIRQLFGLFAEKMKIPLKNMILLDYRESFYYYVLSQPKELCLYDVALYYYSSKGIQFWRLKHDKRTIPQVVTIEEKSCESLLEEKDELFYQMVEKTLPGDIVSSVYLIGDGFDGDWMKKSLAAVCRGRRAFMGKNLFCKGACYAAAAKSQPERWQYVYMGDNEIKINVSLKVLHKGKTEFISMITAGDNWYEAGNECEVILRGSPSVDFWLQRPNSRQAVIRTLDLTDMPERETKTTRLRITAKPVTAERIKLTIKDMGFGEICKSSEKVWEYTMSF